MGRKVVGGFVFVSYAGDHPPLHVHISDTRGRPIGRWDIEGQRPMDSFTLTRRLERALRTAGYLR